MNVVLLNGLKERKKENTNFIYGVKSENWQLEYFLDFTGRVKLSQSSRRIVQFKSGWVNFLKPKFYDAMTCCYHQMSSTALVCNSLFPPRQVIRTLKMYLASLFLPDVSTLYETMLFLIAHSMSVFHNLCQSGSTWNEYLATKCAKYDVKLMT